MDDERRRVYFEVLEDLDDDRVEQAVSALLREDRAELPPPGVIRARAEALPAGDRSDEAGAESRRSEPVEAEVVAEPVEGSPVESKRRTSRKGGLALVFAVLGIFPVSLWLGISTIREAGRDPALAKDGANRAFAIAAIALSGLTVAVAIVLAAIVLVGGGETTSQRSVGEPDAGGDSTLSPEDGRYGLGDTFRDGNFAFRVVSVRTAAQIEGFTAATGATLVRVELVAANVSSQAVAGPICGIGFDGIVLVDDKARNYSAESISVNLSGSTDPLCVDPTQPGLERQTVLAFQVPNAAVNSVAGVAVWDPTEAGDEAGESYYFVDARL